MALIEGGNFRCDDKHFETGSIDEWNKHCTEDCDLHTEGGSTACIICKTPLEYSELPFHPLDANGSKNIMLKCEACEERTTGKVKRRSVVPATATQEPESEPQPRTVKAFKETKK